MLLPRLVELLDFVGRGVTRHVSKPLPTDVPDPMRAARREVHGRVGSEDAFLLPGSDLAASLEDVVHRLHGPMLVDRRAAARPHVHKGDHELPRAYALRTDEL